MDPPKLVSSLAIILLCFSSLSGCIGDWADEDIPSKGPVVRFIELRTSTTDVNNVPQTFVYSLYGCASAWIEPNGSIGYELDIISTDTRLLMIEFLFFEWPQEPSQLIYAREYHSRVFTLDKPGVLNIPAVGNSSVTIVAISLQNDGSITLDGERMNNSNDRVSSVHFSDIIEYPW